MVSNSGHIYLLRNYYNKIHQKEGFTKALLRKINYVYRVHYFILMKREVKVKRISRANQKPEFSLITVSNNTNNSPYVLITVHLSPNHTVVLLVSSDKKKFDYKSKIIIGSVKISIIFM